MRAGDGPRRGRRRPRDGGRGRGGADATIARVVPAGHHGRRGGGRPGRRSRKTPAPAGQRPVDFAADIQPLLGANCLGCHGETLKLSRLDLRTRDVGDRAAAPTVPSLVPGQRRAEPDVPPGRRPRAAGHADARRTAQRRRVATLKRWIDEGAHWDAAPSTAGRIGAPPWRRSKTGRSPTRSAATGRSSRRCRRRCPTSAAAISPIRSIASSSRRAPSRGLIAGAPRRSPHAGAPRLSRPARAAAVAGRGRRLRRRHRAPTRGSGSSTRCWPRRTTASARAGTGSTWRATPTRAASSTTSTGPTPGAIATT